MAVFNVHIDREVRLAFEGIEADTHEAAADIACDKHPAAADDIDSCDGETFAALVEVTGEAENEPSRSIEFQPQRRRKAAAKLLAACEDAFFQFEHNGEESDSDWEVLNELQSVIAEAKTAGIPSERVTPPLLAACLWMKRELCEAWDESEESAIPDEYLAAIAQAKAASLRSGTSPITTDMYDTLRYVAEMLSGLKPDFLHNIGLDVASEKITASLDAFEAKAQGRRHPAQPPSTLPMLAGANHQYAHSSEIVPGLFLDPSGAIYIADHQGEIVSWNHDEISTDPSGFTAALAAVAIATKYGPSAVRENIETGGIVLARLAETTRHQS